MTTTNFDTPGFLLTKKDAKIYRDKISSELASQLLDDAIKLKDEGKFVLSRGYDKDGKVMTLTREQRGTHQCVAGRATLKLNEFIFPKLVSYAQQAFFVGDKRLIRTQDYFLWYDPGFGISLHADDSTNGSTDYYRVLTVLVYLNDDYQGGEIVFPELNFTLKPEVGDLLAFPGNKLFKHKVSPIVSGQRYAVMQTYDLRQYIKVVVPPT